MHRVILFVCLFFMSSLAHAQMSTWKPLGSVDTNMPSYNWTGRTDITAHNTDVYIAFQDSIYGKKLTVRKYASGIWQTVGMPGFSNGRITENLIRVSDAGTVYVAYADAAHKKAICVKKFDGTSWVNVGTPGFSSINATHLAFAIYNNEPYIAYQDAPLGNKAVVRKFDGTNWVSVGTGAVSASFAEKLSLTTGKTGKIYLSYYDLNDVKVFEYNGSSWTDLNMPIATASNISGPAALSIGKNNELFVLYHDGDSNGKATVAKYNGSWSTVGMKGFTQTPIFEKSVISVDTSGLPIVVFQDFNELKIIPYRFNGTSWEDISANNIAYSSNYFLAMAIDGNNIPFVSCSNVDVIGQAAIRTFKNGRWEPTGIKGFTNTLAYRVSTVTTKTGIPYVIYPDFKGKASVMKYDGTNWVDVGSRNISDSGVSFFQIAMDGSNVPYVIFSDLAYTNTFTVMKYDGTAWKKLGDNIPRNIIGYDEWATSFAVDSVGTPYIAWGEYTSNGTLLSVKKFDGTNWVYVGNPGFSDGQPNYVCIKINKGTPYVSYTDGRTFERVIVKRFDGVSWVDAGPKNIATNGGDAGEIFFDKNDMLYVAYRDNDILADGKTSIRKLENGAWHLLGTLGAITPRVYYKNSFAVDDSNNVYTIYTDNNDGFKPKVHRFSNGKWLDVSLGINTLAPAINPEIFINGNNGVVVYTNSHAFAWGGSFQNDLSILTHGQVADNKVKVYPNPSAIYITLEADQILEGNLRIFSSQGQCVWIQVIKGMKKTNIDISQFASGTYHLQFVSFTGSKQDASFSVVR